MFANRFIFVRTFYAPNQLDEHKKFPQFLSRQPNLILRTFLVANRINFPPFFPRQPKKNSPNFFLANRAEKSPRFPACNRIIYLLEGPHLSTRAAPGKIPPVFPPPTDFGLRIFILANRFRFAHFFCRQPVSVLRNFIVANRI
jgi:hypothetical protein